MSDEITKEPINEFEKKLTQEQYNENVAFYVHLKEFNNSVRKDVDKMISDVFYFCKGVDWKFESYGIEKAGSRGKDVLCYFILRTTDLERLKKLFLQNFRDYDNVSKITCSVAKYEKVEENFFELDIENNR